MARNPLLRFALLGVLAAPAALLARQPAEWQWTGAERAYLEARGPIRMCAAPDWMPMDGIRDGRHVGMAADFVQLMAQRGGLDIELVSATTWDEAYAKGQRRECDIFSMLMESPSRLEFLDFTTPYLDIPGVLATSVNVTFVASLEQVLDQPLGHMRGFGGVELLRARYPGIQLVLVDSYEEGLFKVQRGELFGQIGNMISVGHALRANKMTDVKIAGRLEGQDSRMSIATRNDEPMLRAIFERLVLSIQPQERQAIMNRWMPIRFEQGFDRRLFWRSLAIFLVIVAVITYWTLRLRRLNRALAAANRSLAEVSRRDPLTGLFNRMHFREALTSASRLCGRNCLVMSVAILDVDRFKDINDRFGHSFGDACLRHVAAALSATFRRETDTVVRYGGDEFVVLAVGGTSSEFVNQLEAMRRTVEETPVSSDGRDAGVTVSIGAWSRVPDATDESARALEEADAALYRAKTAGRNVVIVAGAEADAGQ